jgi:flagellar motility protein MotE (MotC chaperone)
MSDPNLIIETPVYHLNLTLLLAIITVSLTAMGTLVAIFRKKTKEEELPGKSPFCGQNKTDISRVESSTKENSKRINIEKEDATKKFDALRQLINDTSKEVGILRSETASNTKSLDEMRQDVKEVASKLDDLLKQLLEWMTD